MSSYGVAFLCAFGSKYEHTAALSAKKKKQNKTTLRALCHCTFQKTFGKAEFSVESSPIDPHCIG